MKRICLIIISFKLNELVYRMDTGIIYKPTATFMAKWLERFARDSIYLIRLGSNP